MKENTELNERIVRNWKTGRYKTFSSLARVMHIKFPKIVERAVKRDMEKHRAEVMARALKQAEENQNANDSLNHD